MTEWKVRQATTNDQLEAVLTEMSRQGWTILHVFDTAGKPFHVVAHREKEERHPEEA